MQIGLVGLGRMGMNMGRRWLKGGHEVVAFNRTYAKTEEMLARKAPTPPKRFKIWSSAQSPARCLADASRRSRDRRTSHGAHALLSQGDLVVDGGNNYYKEDIRHAEELKKKESHFHGRRRVGRHLGA